MKITHSGVCTHFFVDLQPNNTKEALCLAGCPLFWISAKNRRGGSIFGDPIFGGWAYVTSRCSVERKLILQRGEPGGILRST